MLSIRTRCKVLLVGLGLMWGAAYVVPAYADEGTMDTAVTETVTIESQAADLAAFKDSSKVVADTLWVLLAAMLVFWMQAGFSLVEAGLTRAKNVVNILLKNLMDFSIASIAFWAVGFGLMFGAGNAYFGTSGWFLGDLTGTAFDSLSWSVVPLEAKFFFQLVFAGTAATIVSGAMAERTQFRSYLLYSLVITLVIYPVSGHWIWGGG